MPDRVTFKPLNVETMLKILPLLALLTACSPTTYYIVRHGEKEAAPGAMSGDVALSAAGDERALALRDRLKSSRIQYVYSTDTRRTKATARPLAETIGAGIETYNPRDTGFVSYVLRRGKGNAVIVGHSNTVDDLVNRFLGRTELQDLPETSFGDLFIITRKGKRITYTRGHFGK
ncbi:MAG: histidine phosphatase family protein [Chitinophagaceae bacterium]|nr:MAG: histidine phosphatase family protein [Chitinophagaceae bacterium]